MITMLSLRNKPSSTAAAKRRRRAAMSPIISPLSPTALLLLRGGGVVSADNNPTKAGLVPSPAAVSAYVETEMIESPTVTSSAIVSPTAQHRQLVTLKYVGNNNDWGSFKLGECEGDCDEDKDCQDGFKCFQREPNQAVEGCQGGDNDSSKTDYCVAKKTPSPTLPPAPTISPKPTSEPTSSPTRMPTTASLPYKIRLYWDPSYFWQETRKETFWCWHCPGGCYEGNKIQIDYCDKSDSFQFYPIGTKNGYPYGKCFMFCQVNLTFRDVIISFLPMISRSPHRLFLHPTLFRY
jgi:hypothetical protein